MSRWDMDLSHNDAANELLLIGDPDMSGAWHRTGLSEAGWGGHFHAARTDRAVHIVEAVGATPPFVVVSGLAASGKTSVAEPLARALDIPLISKDAIKEALFESVGYGDLAWSKALSRAADAALVRLAQDLDAAVLDNFWYAETASDLLAPLSGPMVEVFCRCDPVVALERFESRTRHPGHADAERDPESMRALFVARAHKLPLGTLGPVLEVDTERPVDVDALAALVLAAAPRA
jgi:predicted kinase